LNQARDQERVDRKQETSKPTEEVPKDNGKPSNIKDTLTEIQVGK
jgi:hypothetical protein